MKLPGAALVLTLLLVMVAAGAGTLIGGVLVNRQDPRPSLHTFMHRELDLSPAQEAKLDAMELQFATRRKLREAELRAANAELAAAIQARHTYSPEVQVAVERFHHSMGELQKDTILHVLQMRTQMTPEQAAKFDRRIVEALTAETR